MSRTSGDSTLPTPVIDTETGSFYSLGLTQTITSAHNLVATAASYAITGAAMSFSRAIHFSLAAGSYILSGAAATLRRGANLAALAGAYVITGNGFVQSDFPKTPLFIRNIAASLGLVRKSKPTLYD